jgi:hypothetical protein
MPVDHFAQTVRYLLLAVRGAQEFPISLSENPPRFAVSMTRRRRRALTS